MEESRGTWRSRLTNALEVSATMVPVLVVILGIGMMRIFPHSPSMPIFKNNQEAKAFFSDYQLEYRPELPLVLSSSNCSECSSLKDALNRQNIPFVEMNVDYVQGATHLVTRIRRLTGEPSLPKVLVGNRLISANSIAVRSAVKSARKSQS